MVENQKIFAPKLLHRHRLETHTYTAHVTIAVVTEIANGVPSPRMQVLTVHQPEDNLVVTQSYLWWGTNTRYSS